MKTDHLHPETMSQIIERVEANRFTGSTSLVSQLKPVIATAVSYVRSVHAPGFLPTHTS
jgi:hypothetical protein